MATTYVFADEAGCFTFNRKQNVSKYFILCTVTMQDVTVRETLQSLREDMIWRGFAVQDYFHATTDKQAVRDEVFAAILKHDFTVQAQVCQKSKAQPQVTVSRARFYKVPLYFLFSNGVVRHCPRKDPLLVTTASIGNRKERIAFRQGIQDVVRQKRTGTEWTVDFRPSQCDPCLQVADYCAWAIQRKWESNGKDTRSYDLISDRVTYEYDMWQHGKTEYY